MKVKKFKKWNKWIGQFFISLAKIFSSSKRKFENPNAVNSIKGQNFYGGPSLSFNTCQTDLLFISINAGRKSVIIKGETNDKCCMKMLRNHWKAEIVILSDPWMQKVENVVFVFCGSWEGSGAVCASRCGL